MNTIVELSKHVDQLLACRICPKMLPPSVSGGAVASKVISVGQAPGDKEPKLGRPFAWTAGKTLFKWFESAVGINEQQFRSSIYMAAVCRCFPGKITTGGDRVPSLDEIIKCAQWLKGEIVILKPQLIIPIGKLAIEQFLPSQKLDQIIGQQFKVTLYAHTFDVIPLPHPSGASPWHRKEPGKSLLNKALAKIAKHPTMIEIKANERTPH